MLLSIKRNDRNQCTRTFPDDLADLYDDMETDIEGDEVISLQGFDKLLEDNNIGGDIELKSRDIDGESKLKSDLDKCISFLDNTPNFGKDTSKE